MTENSIISVDINSKVEKYLKNKEKYYPCRIGNDLLYRIHFI